MSASFSTILSIDEFQANRTDNWVVVDCRFSLLEPEQGFKDYQDGHIPGAWYAGMDDELSSPIVKGVTGRHPLPAVDSLVELFSKWGISAQTQVVGYDGKNGAMAARLWWLLQWLGHEKVAVLDGGWRQWLAAGLPVSREFPGDKDVAFIPVLRPELLIQTPEVAEIYTLADYRVIDSREPKRYAGQVEPIDPVAGHIPGAKNLYYMENVDAEGKLLSPDALKARFDGIVDQTPPEKTIIYCGSGVTACQNVLAYVQAGNPFPRMYAGSWSEWITDFNRPIAISALEE